MEIVPGIQQFERAFASFSDSFIVIGGSACRAVLSGGPIQPRRTRDIDMVLVLENVGKDFISAFWKFIKEGGYKFASRKNAEGDIKYVFYSFVGGSDGYPSQIEILSKPVGGIGQPADYHIEYIEIDEDYSHLSAIILDPDYYAYLTTHYVIREGIRYASPDSLICLKTLAYMNLSAERAAGKQVNSDDLKKHRRDVMMAVASLDPTEVFEVSAHIKEVLISFAQAIAEPEISQSIAASLGVGVDYLGSLVEILQSNFTIAQ
ncbi:MAG: hypothetical protein SO114_08510 [Candidatus Cryptobacteroides sp.]|nr:hypothetical protein [Candidatus Cryptobacteroides sp.]